MAKIERLKFKGWPHVLKSQQFTRKWIEKVLFPVANRIEKKLKKKKKLKTLKNKTMVSIFASESSRTRASLEIGFTLLGGKVAFSSPNANISGAMGKGESFCDTLRLFEAYHTDVIVARNDNPNELPINEIAKPMQTPVINAGDGAGKDKQHPTQALLDIYTIYKYFGKIDGLSIAMIGDLKNGRTIRSLCYLLGKWKVNHIYLISPKKLRIEEDIKKYLKRHNTSFSEHQDLRTIAPEVDVFYQTRTQTNLGSPKTNRKGKTEFTIINNEILKIAKKNSIIMHPLPCLKEIDRSCVDKDKRAIYFEGKNGKPSQTQCGLLIRMALLITTLAPKKASKYIKRYI